MERFELPLPPQGLVFPQTPQLYATIIIWLLVLAFVVYSLWYWRRKGDPRALLLTLGGALCYFNEPIVGVLGLCWHPRPGQWVALKTYGPAPLWGLGIYIVFFGSMAHLMLEQVRRGITVKQFRWGIVIFFVVDLCCELPLLQSGVYYYYGSPPMKVMGFPLYWLFINTAGPLLTVAILYQARNYFRGWRILLVGLVPVTTDAAASIVTGWPIFTALNTEGMGMGKKYVAAFVTIGLGLLVLDIVSRLICRDSKYSNALQKLAVV